MLTPSSSSAASASPWSAQRTALALAGLGLAAVGYLVWFDYRRHHDAAFRRRLRQERAEAEQRAQAQARAQAEAKARAGMSPTLKGDLSDVPPVQHPTAPADRERYFMELLSTGERLLGMGPSRFDAAAVCYVRALKIYPDPMKLLEVLQQTMPEPVMNQILMLLSEDIVSRSAKYWDQFPPATMNVRVLEEAVPPPADAPKPANGEAAAPDLKRTLVATRAIAAGDVVYTEQPLIHTATAPGRCDLCLGPVDDMPTGCPACDAVAYCSPACQKAGWHAFHRFLCPHAPTALQVTDPDAASLLEAIGIDADAVAGLPPLLVAPAADAAAFRQHSWAVLAARFLARMMLDEVEATARGEPAPTYGMWDHLERLYMPPADDAAVAANRPDWSLLMAQLAQGVPGLADFLTPMRYATLVNALRYNAYALGRDAAGAANDAEASETEANDAASAVRARGSALTAATQYGLAWYPVSAYLQHACEPNCRLEFRDDGVAAAAAAADPSAVTSVAVGDGIEAAQRAPLSAPATRATLVALQPIAPGDVLRVRYLAAANGAPRDGDGAPAVPKADRQAALRDAFGFTCRCRTCLADAASSPS